MAKKATTKRAALTSASSKRGGTKSTTLAAKKPPIAKRSNPAKSPEELLAEYQRKRDFSKTAEPAGGRASARHGTLRFVIQKHNASHLHFDLRLEIDGVMKSWAVPKGPSADPAVKRLAMQVEDHPIEYNTFEGTIPSGEYGGGTVMLWDRGTYTVDTAEGTDADADNDAAHAGHERGELKVTFHGKRMRGSYAIVRTKGMRGSHSSKPSWLLIKHRDQHARPADEYDVVAENMTSVTTGRTMDEIRDA